MNKILSNSQLHQLMRDWRHDIHAHPETAFKETRTATKIAELLRSFPNVAVHTGLAQTGVVGILSGKHSDNNSPTGSGGGSRMIGLRADIDALDITEANSEQNGVDYASTVPGKMHACGHDGHTAMLLGAAKHLSEHPDFFGHVAFIFQPAEENCGGGEVMVKEGLFEQFPCDSVYGLHNWPGLPVGTFAIHEREVMASTDSFDIIIQGQGTHAAMPNLGVDAIVVAAQLINSLQTIVSRNVAPTDTAVVSITQVNAGSAYNIIPDTATLCGTVRAFAEPVRQRLHQRIRQQAQAICQAHNATATVAFHDAYPATINHPIQARECAEVCQDLVGQSNVRLDEPPSMGAEDFSYMLMEKPGAYIWLGNGEDSYSLHHPKYNFNDDILAIGANYWVALVNRLLTQPQ